MEKARIHAQFSGEVLRVYSKPGEKLPAGTELLSIKLSGNSAGSFGQAIVPVRAFRTYTVSELPLRQGQKIAKGDVIALISYCTHPTAFQNLCAVCGESVEESNDHLQHKYGFCSTQLDIDLHVVTLTFMLVCPTVWSLQEGKTFP